MAWETLRLTGQLVLTRLNDVPMHNEAGESLALETYEQGGSFADDPDLPFPLLYVVNGNEEIDCDCGVHVFEVRDSTMGDACGSGSSACIAKRVDRSANGEPPFSYRYDPGPFTFEEPEGVTFCIHRVRRDGQHDVGNRCRAGAARPMTTARGLLAVTAAVNASSSQGSEEGDEPWTGRQ